MVKLTHETSLATMIQFIVMGLLNIANGLNSIVTNCVEGSSCVSNLFGSVIYFMLITGWFGFIVLLGYMAHERRSKRFAQALIAAEGMVALIAYFNARHYPDHLGLITSLVDLVLALWIITLAFRLMRSGGKRITKQRPRQRRRSPA